MSENHVLETVRKLVELQKYDSQIFALKRDAEDKPALLQQLQAEFESKKATLKKVEADFKAIQVARHTLEGDLAAKEEAIRKSDGQLAQIKTNKEYQAKIKETEGLKADASMIEEKILLSYDQADAIKSDLEREKGHVAKEEEAYQAKKRVLDQEIADISARIKDLEGRRAALLEGIDKPILQRYEKILQHKDGLAIVPVTDVCGGCFMNVPVQVINEIKKHEDLISCEMCARLLYIKEDMLS